MTKIENLSNELLLVIFAHLELSDLVVVEKQQKYTQKNHKTTAYSSHQLWLERFRPDRVGQILPQAPNPHSQ